MNTSEIGKFTCGTTVIVKSIFPPGHIRTPFFTRGHRGRIVQALGRFGDPEELAYGRNSGAPKTLYRVAFKQSELWPGYDGPECDELIADIYEHWLETAND